MKIKVKFFEKYKGNSLYLVTSIDDKPVQGRKCVIKESIPRRDSEIVTWKTFHYDENEYKCDTLDYVKKGVLIETQEGSKWRIVDDYGTGVVTDE